MLYLLQQTLQYIEHQNDWISCLKTVLTESEQKYEMIHAMLTEEILRKLTAGSMEVNANGSRMEETEAVLDVEEEEEGIKSPQDKFGGNSNMESSMNLVESDPSIHPVAVNHAPLVPSDLPTPSLCLPKPGQDGHNPLMTNDPPPVIKTMDEVIREGNKVKKEIHKGNKIVHTSLVPPNLPTPSLCLPKPGQHGHSSLMTNVPPPVIKTTDEVIREGNKVKKRIQKGNKVDHTPIVPSDLPTQSLCLPNLVYSPLVTNDPPPVIATTDEVIREVYKVRKRIHKGNKVKKGIHKGNKVNHTSLVPSVLPTPSLCLPKPGQDGHNPSMTNDPPPVIKTTDEVIREVNKVKKRIQKRIKIVHTSLVPPNLPTPSLCLSKPGQDGHSPLMTNDSPPVIKTKDEVIREGNKVKKRIQKGNKVGHDHTPLVPSNHPTLSLDQTLPKTSHCSLMASNPRPQPGIKTTVEVIRGGNKLKKGIHKGNKLRFSRSKAKSHFLYQSSPVVRIPRLIIHDHGKGNNCRSNDTLDLNNVSNTCYNDQETQNLEDNDDLQPTSIMSDDGNESLMLTLQAAKVDEMCTLSDENNQSPSNSQASITSQQNIPRPNICAEPPVSCKPNITHQNRPITQPACDVAALNQSCPVCNYKFMPGVTERAMGRHINSHFS